MIDSSYRNCKLTAKSSFFLRTCLAKHIYTKERHCHGTVKRKIFGLEADESRISHFNIDTMVDTILHPFKTFVMFFSKAHLTA